MSERIEKTTVTHDDGTKKTQHTFMVKKSTDGNTKTYHGYGGKSGSHTTIHKNDSQHRR